MVNNKQNNYLNFIKENKILKSTVNGIYRFLVLWIIKYHGPIHGYAILKELDKFFETLISQGVLKKTSSSKLYPILRQMEEFDLIIETVGEYGEDNNVKYYQITEKGVFFLKYMFDKIMLHAENPHWKLIYDDLTFEK